MPNAPNASPPGRFAAAEPAGQAGAAATRDLVLHLRDPRCYPHPVAHVTLIETHISYLLLTGPYAYKIKKPLRLPFLDYSTLELRRLACEEELALNRRTAPDLYLDVVPVGGSIATPAVAGAGAVLEYAVRMREFAADALLIDLLRRDALLPRHVDALAQTVAAFHATLPPADRLGTCGEPAGMLAWMTENFTALDAMPLDAALRSRLAALRTWTDASFRTLEPALHERKRAGWIRECHGDLHLANVTLIDDAPVPFDCIEFNPALRWIDTMSEVAFLFMDLVHAGRTDYAYRFLNAYLEVSGDYAGVALLPFYAVYRALVRAKVAGLRAAQTTGPTLAEPAQRELAGYVTLAESLARHDSARWLIITHGLSGSGKSTVTQRALEVLPAIRVRSDVERKRLHGLAPLGRTQSALGGGIYAKGATERTYTRLAELAKTLLRSDFSVIVDATFLRQDERTRFGCLAHDENVPFAIIVCTAPRATLEARIRARHAGGRDVSEADLAVLARQWTLAEPVDPREADQSLIIQTDAPIESVREETGRAIAQLAHPRGFDPAQIGRADPG